MAKQDRTGNRLKRNQRQSKHVPEMGYYLIVTDTEATERCFFTGLHKSLPPEIHSRLVIKVIETNTRDLINKCLELTAYEVQYRIPWIVFDRDKVYDFDSIISKAGKNGIHVAWSNPCFEIWMFAYFGSMPNIRESWICCEQFSERYKKETGHEYSKSDEKLYFRLHDNGNENDAINIAQRIYERQIKDGNSIPSKMCPCTTVHELVREIKTKIAQ